MTDNERAELTGILDRLSEADPRVVADTTAVLARVLGVEDPHAEFSVEQAERRFKRESLSKAWRECMAREAAGL